MLTTRHTMIGIAMVFVVQLALQTALAEVIYVDDDASGTGDGSSWESAYPYLQDALAAAEVASKPIEIRVAQGLYLPDRSSSAPDGTGEREATFQLINGVTLSGGYAGGGASDPNAQDVLLNETILSGDLAGDDPSDDINNSIHVVTASGTAPSAVIVGFTITAGRAKGDNAGDFSEPEDFGGAMYNDRGNPTIEKCYFVYNSGDVCAAVYNYRCSPKLTDCVFILNNGWLGGGAIRNRQSNPVLTNCHFLRNRASAMSSGGGGLYNEDGSNPTLINCFFEENYTEAGPGGAIYNDNSSVVLTNCTFKKNRASREYHGRGGAIYCETDGRLVATNCLFIGNSANHSGGAFYCYDRSHLQIINCTFLGNSAQRGHALACSYHGQYEPGDPNHTSEIALTNCVLWDGGAEVWNGDYSSIEINFSNVNGGWDAMGSQRRGIVWGEGNLDEDPLLTPDGHLQAGSPCIDAGDDTAIFLLPAWEDMDGDTRLVDVPDVIGNLAGFFGIIDMGADEFYDSDRDKLPDWWEERYFSDAQLADPNADSDNDGLVNLKEYGAYGSHPNIQPVYVDGPRGSDAYDGRWPMPRGNGVGPKKTIQAGIDMANNGDTVLVAPAWYGGAGNRDLDFYGRSIVLRAASAQESTVIECQGYDRAFHFHSGEMAGTAVIGFTIQHGRADGGGGIRIEGASPRLEKCRFLSNTSVAEIHRLTFSTGYDFSRQKDVVTYEGDFYYHKGTRDNRVGEYQFGADYPDWGQRGLIDLGPKALGDIDTIPTEGYVKNAEAIIGHAYVALAKEDEADFCIVFRVLAKTYATVTVDYMYVDRNAWPNYTPPGGAIYCSRGYPILEDCQINSGTPDGIFMQDAGARILGTIILNSATWLGQNVTLTGNGRIYVNTESVLNLDDSTIRCNVDGPGTILVDLESELIIEEKAHINLLGRGLIQCDGLLHLRGEAHLMNAEINVTRAQFEGSASISNSIITAESGAARGQFFIEGTVEVIGNVIQADGDRYLDLDQSVFDGLIADNFIHVTITEGIGKTRGGLLELRASDFYQRGPPDDGIFLHQIPRVPDFNNSSWTIDRLVLAEGAKLNLANRFSFNEGGIEEVMYVRELALGPDSVFNSGLQTLYYQDLVLLNAQGEEIERNPGLSHLWANGAAYKNVPLLGFSLYNIALDDDEEFSLRVEHNNAGSVRDSRYDAELVERIDHVAPDPHGMMRMRNYEDSDPHSLTTGQTIHARAKGLFARSIEGQILIQFEYLFEDANDPNTELIVYLSDVPGLPYRLPNSPPDPNHVIVGRIRPPDSDRPGSVGSARFGVFHTYTHRHNLNFTEGTRIELELVGSEGTRILINNWDPQVHCSTPCMDLDGTGVEDVFDLMGVLGESGKSAGLDSEGLGNECVDGMLSNNGYADAQDLISMEWALDTKPDNLCPGADREGRELPLVDSGMATLSSALSGLNAQGGSGFSSPLLILGQGRWNIDASANLGTERIYGLNDEGQYLSTRDFGDRAECHAKLITQGDDAVYSVNIKHGILQLHDDGSSRVAFSNAQHESVTQGDVYIGVHSDGLKAMGRPVWDAVVTTDSIYVVPVVVTPGAVPGEDTAPAYLAAAKLSRTGGVEMIFDDPGFRRPLTPDNPHLGGLREIEVDAADRVYVLNAHRRNISDALWQYNAQGVVNWRVELGDPNRPRYHSNVGLIEDPNRPVYAPNPLGLCVSNQAGRVYLASGYRDEQGRNRSYVYGFSMADGSLECIVTINDMQIITGISADPATGTLWVVGYNLDAHALAAESYLYISESFYQARLVSIPHAETAVREVMAHAIASSDQYRSHDLILPLSIVWNSGVDPG